MHVPVEDEGKDEIIIEGIRFHGRCGVTREERQRSQPLLADLAFTYSAADAIPSDNIAKTVDYAQVVQRVVDVGTAHETALLERLADQIAQVLLAEFSIDRLRIWLRKAAPPLSDVTGSVGVRLTYPRSRASVAGSSSPSPFLIANVHVLPKGKVLDVATGQGRHALYLAAQGYEVIALDRDTISLEALARTANDRHLSNLSTWEADLETTPPALGDQIYDGIVVFFYLFRPLFPALLRALKPGGVLIYETFLIDNHRQFQHPRRKEFCLEHNELLELTKELRVLSYQEGPQPSSPQETPAITARLVAQKPF